jgi:hypothetical protein
MLSGTLFKQPWTTTPRCSWPTAPPNLGCGTASVPVSSPTKSPQSSAHPDAASPTSTAAALSDDATAAPFQFSPALAAQQVGRALSAQTLARSRSDHQQAYLDAMAPVSTEERQQRAIRTATAGLAALSRRRQPGPLIGGLGSLAGTPDPSVDTPSADIPGLTGGTPIIMGDLPIAQVHTTLQALLPTLRACTTADGQITLKLVVQQDGTVGQALVSEGDLGPANTCIIETLQTAQFNMPADTGIVVLKYPLHFHAEP